MTTSGYYENLKKNVIEHSQADDWHSAVNEWEIDDVEEDETLTESCVCGKENLRYLFTIRNEFNGKKLYPIGSSCIKKFKRIDLDEEVAVKEQLFKLLHAIENNSFLILSSEFFSRKLLLYLYELGAFKATVYNQYDPRKDYLFMRDMFNKRTEPTKAQKNKANAIIADSLKPFLRKMLQGKVRRKNEKNL